MGILGNAKDLMESKVSNASDLSEEEVDKAGEVLSKAMGKISDMGIDEEAFLETAEGKKVKMEIIKYYAKKYWWALTLIGIFDVIGIFAAVKYSASKR